MQVNFSIRTFYIIRVDDLFANFELKFLLIQNRGPLLDEGVTRRRTESVNAHTEAISVPSCSFYDMKICYSSLPSDAEEESW